MQNKVKEGLLWKEGNDVNQFYTNKIHKSQQNCSISFISIKF